VSPPPHPQVWNDSGTSGRLGSFWIVNRMQLMTVIPTWPFHALIHFSIPDLTYWFQIGWIFHGCLNDECLNQDLFSMFFLLIKESLRDSDQHTNSKNVFFVSRHTFHANQAGFVLKFLDE